MAGNSRAISGNLFVPVRAPIQIEYAGSGQHRIVELDPAEISLCGNHLQNSTIGNTVVASAITARPAARTAGTEPADSPIIDILVVYTQKALDGAGGQDGIDALIDERILEHQSGIDRARMGVDHE
jgi:hypothetical protein